jgi:type IV secretory pathway VirB4 component
VERVLFDGADPASRDWRTALDAFARETAQIVDLLSDALPEVARLDDGELLTWLHDCVSPRSVQLALPATPMFLDAWLADASLLGGVSPTLDGQTLKVVSVRGLPASTRPGLLDALGALPFPYRWSARWIGLDKADAEVELVKLRKRWFAKRKGVGVLLREAITKEEVPLLDTDAAAKTEECDGALEALGADACAYPQGRVVVFDKGRSARAAALAVGGRWHPLQPGGAFTLQPLSRIEDDGERAWASEWLADAVRVAGLALTPRIREEIWEALGALAQAPVAQRTLTVFTALVQDKAVAAALEPFTLKGPHGALIDGVAPGDETLAAFECFELERLMATPSAVAPVLAALFHDIERGFDGRPTLLILDEAWLFLDETAFAARIREWLKTLRKKGVAVIFATQSLDDVVRSSIASALIESCPTQIFLPNPRALEPASADLYRMFGLNRRQLELIAWATPKRTYYLRQPEGRRLFDLKLSGAGLALCGASSPEDQTLIERVLVALDPADPRPDRFAREFLKARGRD